MKKMKKNETGVIVSLKDKTLYGIPTCPKT
jgi:hypothetical protein